jgi:uncharacterized glyoxalase superfamily protein PhnB
MAGWRSATILGARDVKRAVDHYCNVLGFQLDSMFEGVGAEGGAYGIVHRDQVSLHIQIRRRELFRAGRESIESDVYLYVDDVDALFEELRTRGAQIVREPVDSEYGLRDFVVEDLDGHRLVFGSPLGGA